MSADPIVDEIHRIREKIASKHNYDISAIVAAAMDEQSKSGRKVVTCSPRTRIDTAKKTKRRAVQTSVKRVRGRTKRKAD